MPKFSGSPRRFATLAFEEKPRPGSSGRIDAACQLCVAGKLALRDVAAWAQPFGLSETEFRLLWLLSQVGRCVERAATALDQGDLAERLAVSTGQISAVVERLQKRELVDRVLDGGDRRRQLWRLAPAGEAVMLAVVASVECAQEDAA